MNALEVLGVIFALVVIVPVGALTVVVVTDPLLDRRRRARAQADALRELEARGILGQVIPLDHERRRRATPPDPCAQLARRRGPR